MMNAKPDLAAASLEELQTFCSAHAFPAFRAKQIHDWIYHRFCAQPQAMNNLPKPLRAALEEAFAPAQAQTRQCVAAEDGSVKHLIALHDHQCVEAVRIPGIPDRLTLCLSSQVGCPVRCRFCASGSQGLQRNLTAGEILEEFYLLSQADTRPVTNLVFMGIGEPLLNFNHVALAIERLTAQEYIRFSPRRITVSTSGITAGIEKLSALDKPLYLALSLHATDDQTRAQIIPDAFREPIAPILAACERFTNTHNRIVTLEYALIDHLNCSDAQARELAQIARRLRAKVNLIPYNKVAGVPFERPPKARIENFVHLLEQNGAMVTIRYSKGASASAACGQLRIQNDLK